MLDAALDILDLRTASLKKPAPVPDPSAPVAEWADLGEWLVLAHRLSAANLFFVDRDPVLIFKEVTRTDEGTLREVYRRAWSMARPQYLFISAPGELSVYSLAHPPARTSDEWKATNPLGVVRRASEIAETLVQFRRSRVESGEILETVDPSVLRGRADQRLVSDLSYLRRALLAHGLEAMHVHALIGRSIFIRYLEDRRVLTRKYFQDVAAGSSRWQQLLEADREKVDFSSGTGRYYDRVLKSKGFTYALFAQLAKDFNGDMFPSAANERSAIRQDDLELLRQFLLGDVQGSEHPSLFFWAYDFAVVPTELISSIYEQFYHESVSDSQGTHYTPVRLVEDVLVRTLTAETLEAKPRVLDPSCGSGIFLVEAYKRIVRHASARAGRRLTPSELRSILRDQIAGIEINGEAARIAAFSLYLALLGFQEPPSILARRRLPSLIATQGPEEEEESFGILAIGSAFAPALDEVESSSSNVDSTLPFRTASFDIVLGNPPWEEAVTTVKPRKVRRTKSRRTASVATGEAALQWATHYNLPVGDKGYSQLFLHRALSFVGRGGSVGMLVHANVLFNQRSTSRAFREYLLTNFTLREVVSFVHVRRLVFDRAIAPFVFLKIDSTQPSLASHRFSYATARHTHSSALTALSLMSRCDTHAVAQADVLARDYLWKTYAWGSHRDAALMQALDAEDTIADVIGEPTLNAGFGFQRGDLPVPGYLQDLPILSSTNLRWYGPLLPTYFEDPPTGVSYTPSPRFYSGLRLIATRAVKGELGVCARLESRDFAFRHLIYCIKLDRLEEWQAKVLLGTIWSNLGRYRMFMRSAGWGTWYDQFTAEDWLTLPARIPSERTAIVDEIVGIVDRIRGGSDSGLLEDFTPARPEPVVLDRLNSAIFELFGLAPGERDLIQDWSEYTYDLFRRRSRSSAIRPLQTVGNRGRLFPPERITAGELTQYLRALAEEYRHVVRSQDTLDWSVHFSRDRTFIAVVLAPNHTDRDRQDQLGWSDVLQRLPAALGSSSGSTLYIQGMMRALLPDAVVIAKRNERRLWTASSAREDGEAILAQAITVGA